MLQDNPPSPASSSSSRTFYEALPVYEPRDGQLAPAFLAEKMTDSPAVVAAETSRQPAATSFREKSVWMVLYFSLSLVLTIQNKWVMSRFSYPYVLTGVHALCNSVGILGLILLGKFKPVSLTRRQASNLFLFSILYAVNIAVSNASLNLVTVPVHQVVRSLTPIMVVLLSLVVLHQRFALRTYLCLGTVTFGVAIATYGNYGLTVYGLLLTLLGALLAAIKTLTATSMLKAPAGTKLSPLDILFFMSPLAVVHMVVFAFASGEATKVYELICGLHGTESVPYKHLFYNGLIAFALNVVSFTANKKTGPVAVSVAANIKQVLSIVLAIFVFDLHVAPFNACGILITLSAGVWYAQIEFSAKKEKATTAAEPLGNQHGPGLPR